MISVTAAAASLKAAGHHLNVGVETTDGHGPICFSVVTI